ncbi:MAG: LamG-like jellyroll fold domain-containing protein [Bacteroidota bacterium]
MKLPVLLVLALSLGTFAFAQPAITSFAPAAGVPGDQVTITGTNFDTTPANNIVKFNGITAVVTASSATSITTSVPNGATSGLISVMVGSNTGTSTSVFCVSHTAVSTSGLLAFYTFSGNSNDLSGNNNNATSVGTTLTTDRCGNANSAMLFDGSSNSYVNIPTSSSMESIITTQEITISAWINISNISSTVFPVFERYNPNTDNGLLFEVNNSVGGELFNVDYSGGASANCSRTWSLNQWYYISVTYSKAAGVVKFYVNGVLACSIPYSQTITTDIPRDFRIGQSLSGPDEFTNGVIDEFRLYNRALSDCEIESLYSLTTISSFTPTSGQFGTSVTIAGKNFDASPANNKVLFNGLPATVTASSPTSITATVPAGATTGPITVTALDCNPVNSTTDFTVTYAVPFGNTVTMNGTTDYINIADNAVLRPSNLTLETWVNFSSPPAGQVLIGKALNTTGNNNSYALYYLNGYLRGFVNNNATQNPEIVFPWTPVIGQWYHTAFTYDDATKTQSLYLNGALVASGTTVAGPEYNNTPITIGGDFDFGSYDAWLSGTMDEVRIWNIARTQLQIRGALNTTLVGNETGLVGYYKMDEVGYGAGITTVNSATATGSVINGITVGTACTPIFTTGVPTLTFSPVGNYVGGTVTLTGTTFSTTPANNIVKFNDVTATVTASTTTSITTTVPTGATTGPVSVNNGCFSFSGSKDFIVYTATIAVGTQPAANTSVCSGTPVTLNVAASGTTNIGYHWQLLNAGTGLYNDLADNAVYSGTTTATLTINTNGGAGSGSYRCRVSGDLAPDVNSNAAIVGVIPQLLAPGVSPVTICTSKTATLIASGGLDGNYRWYTTESGGQAIAGEVNASFTTPALTADATYYVSLASAPCESARSSATVTVQVCNDPTPGELSVYNAVSPNGDQKNDLFYIANISTRADTKENKVSIFNRWGDLVFSVNNYDNVNNVFRGLSDKGAELPSGTYYYKIEFTGGRKTVTGYLSLKR